MFGCLYTFGVPAAFPCTAEACTDRGVCTLSRFAQFVVLRDDHCPCAHDSEWWFRENARVRAITSSHWTRCRRDANLMPEESIRASSVLGDDTWQLVLNSGRSLTKILDVWLWNVPTSSNNRPHKRDVVSFHISSIHIFFFFVSVAITFYFDEISEIAWSVTETIQINLLLRRASKKTPSEERCYAHRSMKCCERKVGKLRASGTV